MIRKLQGLRSFVAIVRWGSVRRAAERQNYDTSTVRSHVRELERRLHLPLLRRGDVASAGSLTPEGEKLAPHAERAVDAVDDVQAKAAEIADERS